VTLWWRQTMWTAYDKRRVNLDTDPCPTVMAEGINGIAHGQYSLEDDGMPRDGDADIRKPPYVVPTMEEIRAIPWNGLTVATTFAGGGGSSVGYRMAGYKVVYANEVVATARDTYAANMDPHTILDPTDVRSVKPEDIMRLTGLPRGALDILDGSPPCVSFSTAGKRQRGWGRVTASHDITQRHDDLFYEYARLLDGLQPKVFVAENVSGLVKGTAKGYFIEILRALRACGYVVEARLLDAQWLGVPQMRQRIIYQGVRNDLARKPAWPSPLPYRYAVRDALPHITGVRRDRDRYDHDDGPSPTVLATDGGRTTTKRDTGLGYVEARIAVGNNVEPKFGSPDDHSSPTITASRARISGLVESRLVRPRHGWFPGEARSLDKPHPTVCGNAGSIAGTIETRAVHDNAGWHADEDMTDRPANTVGADRSATHHVETSRHADPRVARVERTPIRGNFNGRVAQAHEPAPTILTCHNGFNEIAIQGRAHHGSVALAHEPSPTILSQQGSRTDPVVHGQVERRKFTIDELKAICSFPPDYVMKGSYSDQWARCGNAVPPVMMRHIAEAIRDNVLKPTKGQ